MSCCHQRVPFYHEFSDQHDILLPRKLPKRWGTVPGAPGWPDPGYQKVLIDILTAEDVFGTCLLLKNQTPQHQYNILSEKIQSLFEEVAEMNIRYNEAPLGQTSLITVPNSVTTSAPVTKLNPTSKRESFQTEMSKLRNDMRNDMKKMQKERKEDTQRERKPGTVETENQGSRYQGSGNHRPENSNPRQDGNQSGNHRSEFGAPQPHRQDAFRINTVDYNTNLIKHFVLLLKGKIPSAIKGTYKSGETFEHAHPETRKELESVQSPSSCSSDMNRMTGTSTLRVSRRMRVELSQMSPRWT